MQDSQRQQILDNARYLQHVRPIDPEEIHEYVDGQPHPAVVKRVLRSEALSLTLIERDDETFVPAPEGPVDSSFGGVDRFPEAYGRALENELVEAYGPGWPDGESGDRLRERIREIKRRYLDGEDVTYDRETALGYALYHLPAYYATGQYVVADLARDGRIPQRLRVLDIGAGVGGPALGIHDLLPEDALVDYHAVEPSAAAGVLESLLESTTRNFHPSIHRVRAQAFEPEGEFDLILFGNVLSELEDPASVIERYVDALSPDGSIVALAPADRETAIGLRDIERTVERRAGLTVYDPTVRLWPGAVPESDSWSFDTQPDVAVPGFQRRLDEGKRAGSETDRQPGDGEFVNVDVQYAYGIWRTDGATAFDYRPNPDRTAKMRTAEDYVTERINLAAVKLSGDLADGGNPLFLLGDGSQRTDHFAVVTEQSMLNEDLGVAAYGDPLRFENALVLWNDDEGAYNVVVDAETVVDRIPV